MTSDEEPSGESGLSPEHEAIKLEAEQRKASLAERARSKKAPPVKAAVAVEEAPPVQRPKAFDPLHAPESGYPVKLSDETWATIHGDNPNEIWKRERHMECVPEFHVEKAAAPCDRCGARVTTVIQAQRSCLGCGNTEGS
jgi:hypothetical protein